MKPVTVIRKKRFGFETNYNDKQENVSVLKPITMIRKKTFQDLDSGSSGVLVPFFFTFYSSEVMMGYMASLGEFRGEKWVVSNHFLMPLKNKKSMKGNLIIYFIRLLFDVGLLESQLNTYPPPTLPFTLHPVTPSTCY